jgi:predicted transposase YdaD
LEKGEAIGLEKGEAIGLEKGRTEEKEQVAVNAFKAEIPIESISTFTGLTAEQITEILKRRRLL